MVNSPSKPDMLPPHEEVQKATLRAFRKGGLNFLHYQHMHDVTPDEVLHKLQELLDRIALYLIAASVLRAMSGLAALLRLEEED
jgi:hypothetical protein